MEPITSTAPDAAVILNAGQLIGMPKQLPGFRPYAVLPDAGGGSSLEYIEEAQLPGHVTACPKFDDAGSLIAYFKDFNEGAGRLFADIDACTVGAIIDYHCTYKADPVVPDWCQHRASFQAKHSEEWKTWISRNGKQMSQVEFAQFLEDNLIDISRPDGARMLEVALSIEACKSGSFKSARRLDNGDVSFGYVEQTTATAGPKGSVEIPKDFDVQLRPFIGCEKHTVTARLRYRIDDGALRLWFELVRHEDVKRLAFDAIVAKIADETGVKVLLGKP
jgi:uncharacterized protein YfdQ (DUF2303 family)